MGSRWEFVPKLWDTLGFWRTLAWLRAQDEANEAAILHELVRWYHGQE